MNQESHISVMDPISRAIDWTTAVLFRPFAIEKWIVLGFCAWLARLGEGASGPSGSSRWERDDYQDGLRQAWDWTLAHLIPVLIVAGFVITFLLVVWLVILWVSSRGKFLFLDGVVHNRAAVVEPWNRFRAQANSLFFFRVAVNLVALAGFGAVLVFLGFAIWSGLEEGHLEPLAIAAIVLAVLAILAMAIVLALIQLVIKDFIVPLMYLSDRGVMHAWSELGDLISARPGVFILYVALRFLIAIALATLGIMVCCLTCCLVLLPYIGTVILLPLWVFLRSYPLFFLGQFGAHYSRFATIGSVAEASAD